MSSSAKPKKAFVVGPGFIGWNVVDLLVGHGYIVTGLVRRQSHADGIARSGATPITGDLNDSSLITSQTAQHDVIIHTATADHLPSAQAILEGVKQRASKGLMTVYIHTSGTSVLDDGAKGAFKSDKMYSDDKREGIDSLPDDAPHRQIDLAIVKVHKELGDKAKIAIMIPPLIYGFNPRHQRLTIQIPTLTRFALKHGFAPHLGKGLAVESNIHVLDLARAYLVLLHHMEDTDPSSREFSNPYYFCETTGDNEPSWHDVASVIGEGLHKAGKISSPEPKELSEELFDDAFREYSSPVIGLNSRSRANRLRALGWSPIEKSWRESYLDDELPEILKEETGGFNGYKGTVAS